MSLSAAATWGAADFNGGLAARRAPVIPVAALSQLAGCLFMAVLAVAFREPLLSGRALWLSMLAGAGNALGITSLYRALASGKMGITADRVLAAEFQAGARNLKERIRNRAAGRT